MTNRAGKRKAATAFDALDTPMVSLKKPFLHSSAHFPQISAKLNTLLDQERYKEAKLLFTEMVKSTRYDFKNLWQAGIEVIGRASPNELAGYLKAVFISSPPKLSTETFNVYMDQLLLEENWQEALEEMELRYNVAMYHHPIVLRKMALCAYNLWKNAFEKLPESYFEEEVHDQYDLQHVRYQKYLRSAMKYLPDVHKTFLRDPEIFELYFDFLDKIGDEEEKRNITLASLEVFNSDPDFYLLFALMKHNKDSRYFNNEDYIIPLYEFDPFLKSKVKGLKAFCAQFTHELKEMKEDENTNQEDLDKKMALAIRIFRLFVNRVEHGNVEAWFCNRIIKICKLAMCQEIGDVYFYYKLDDLLRSDTTVQSGEASSAIKCADKLNEIIADYIPIHNKRLVVSSQSVEGDEREEREIIDEDEQEEEEEEQVKYEEEGEQVKVEEEKQVEEEEKQAEEEQAEEEENLSEEEQEVGGKLYVEGESFYAESIYSSSEEEDNKDEVEEFKPSEIHECSKRRTSCQKNVKDEMELHSTTKQEHEQSVELKSESGDDQDEEENDNSEHEQSVELKVESGDDQSEEETDNSKEETTPDYIIKQEYSPEDERLNENADDESNSEEYNSENEEEDSGEESETDSSKEERETDEKERVKEEPSSDEEENQIKKKLYSSGDKNYSIMLEDGEEVEDHIDELYIKREKIKEELDADYQSASDEE